MIADRKAAREWAKNAVEHPLCDWQFQNLAAAFLELAEESRRWENVFDAQTSELRGLRQRTADLRRRLDGVEAVVKAIRQNNGRHYGPGEHCTCGQKGIDALCASALSAQPNAAAEQGREVQPPLGESPGSAPAATPIVAHSKSMYRRLSTQGANVVPPADPAILGLELAAKICEDYQAKSWDAYLTGYFPDRDNEHTQGASNGASDCAKAIRDEIAKRRAG